MLDEPDNLSPPDVRVRSVLLVAVGVLLLLGGALAIAMGLYDWKAPKRSFVSPRAFPPPRVLETQKQEAQQQWISGPRPVETSEEGTRSTIPIEQAMELIVKRGAGGYAPIEQKVLAQKATSPSAKEANRPSTEPRSHARSHAKGRSRRRIHRR